MKEYTLNIGGKTYNVVINTVSGDAANVTVNGVTYQVGIQNNAVTSVQECAPAVSPVTAAVQAQPQPSAPSSAPAVAGSGKTVTSPLPGVIIAVKVNVGDCVKAGQEIAVLEAMKMENSIEATADGTITSVQVNSGDSILEGAPIVTIG